MGSMGAENLLTQKASYETKEGKSRGEALLDTWKGMMDTPVVLRGGVCWGGEVKPKKKLYGRESGSENWWIGGLDLKFVVWQIQNL